MNCEDRDAQLNDHVDGLLVDQDRDEFEKHLTECPHCTARIEAYRSIQSEAAGLPKTIEPDNDLWQGIADRLEPKGPASIPFPRKTSLQTGLLRALAWAAVILVVIAAAVTYSVLPVSDPPVGPNQAVTNEMPPELVQAEAEFALAKEELLAVFDDCKDFLSPDTVRVFEENMAIIDEAITGTKVALAEDPANKRLVRVLMATHQREISLMRKMTKISNNN